MAISLLDETLLCQRDCHAALAMTGRAKWVRMSLPYPVCHREERSDVAISLLDETLLCQRDCHAALAMTGRAKWVRMSLPALD